MQLIKGQRQQVGHPASYVTTCIGLLTLLARVRTLACKWLSRRPLGHPSSLSSRRPCPWEEEEGLGPRAGQSVSAAAAAVATEEVLAEARG